MPNPRVILRARRARPFFGLHPWVYAGAVDRVEGDPSDGAVVDLVSHAGDFVARGYYNSHSKIRIRLFTWDAAVELDDALLRQRLADAVYLRRDLLRLIAPGQACRVVFSEADGLSGMTADLYDRWLCVQFTSLALAQRKEAIADMLMELLQPEGIYLRTEKGIGLLEGLQIQDALLRGQVPTEPIVIHEGAVRMQVNLTEGQKTGFYLDQRDNRQFVARFAPGRRMLDAFCYSGGFGLHAAKAGASSVLGVDVSEPALALARSNAQLNGLDNLTFEKSDVFDRLDQLVAASEHFGLIVLDPPKFARAGNAVDEAMRGYRRLQSQSLRLIDTDGILVVCCCTGLITREMLHELLAQIAADSKRSIQILDSRGPSPDHPVAATCPETSYLKCIVCRVGAPLAAQRSLDVDT